ncbi:MAG: cadherin-like beta sandwich domain-containing protein [Bifidobacteriaceae bacterium]|jgi:LPXTG-motif cell wall-anchored protein|nr:cadherin-like beta sandwich domain-containing protein [Bifidobacteriaceae bacterium]MCI1978959.1 cadherin-like beta sandwich domain-containing protein [Bifidobacteriaceae bacterium]
MEKMKTGRLSVCLSAALVLASLAAPTVASAAPTTPTDSSTISADVMKQIYDEVKTPYDYGIVLPKGDQPADFDSELTDQMNVFKIPGDNDYVYTTYVGKDINRKTDGTDNTGYSTGLARSKDMVTWEKLGKILSPDKDFYSASTAGYLVKNHTWGDLPTPHLTADGKYALTVLSTNEHGYEQGDKRGGVAFSPSNSFFNEDGSVAEFTMYDKPILDGSASYESGTIWAVKTIWDEENQRYVAFYNASHGPEVMNQAYSTDLIHWTREANNPVLQTVTQPNGEQWGQLYNGDADVVKIGDYWVMFYFTDTPVKIGNKIKPNNVIDSFAVSKDMVHWTKSDYKLTAKNSTFAKSYAHKPAVVKKNGVVYHYYNAVSNQDRNMALSTSVDLSPIKEAKHVLENSNDALLSNLLTKAQKELIKDGGSLKEVTAALSAIRMHLHPEADASLRSATLTYEKDGSTQQLGLKASGTTYSATLPSSASKVRLYAAPVASSAAVTTADGTEITNAGIGLSFDAAKGISPLKLTVTSADGTTKKGYTVKVASDAKNAGTSNGNSAAGPGANTNGSPSATPAKDSNNDSSTAAATADNGKKKAAAQSSAAAKKAAAAKAAKAASKEAGATEATAGENASSLAHTGSSVVFVLIAAAILVAGGAALLLKARKQRN